MSVPPDRPFDASPFEVLPASPFARLRALLDGLAPGQKPISLALGEPQHAPPAFVLESLRAAMADYGRYPPIGGTAEWRAAAEGWLRRRFALRDNFLAGETDILPLTGTREGLFLAAQLAPVKKDGLMAMPNPFYQVYASAAVAAGATPIYFDAPKETGFLPDLAALDMPTLKRLRALYLCSPANPQGAIADKAYLRQALDIARTHNVLLLVDECYSEIYDAGRVAPPPSMLEVMAEEEAAGSEDAPVMVFHSLSKRSNLAGLRSGLVAGGARVMAAYHKLRMVAGPQSPFAAQSAAALAWGDDAHVAENRALYAVKLDMAENVLGGHFDFYRPAGGFFLWLNVGAQIGDGEAAARRLWQEEGIRVLPGAYLTMPNTGGANIGAPYIRVALVAPFEETQDALTRLRDCLLRARADGLD